MLKAATAGLAALGFAGGAYAQETDDAPRPWLLSGTLSASRTAVDGDAVLSSGTISLERSFDTAWVGVSIGAAEGEAKPPPLLTVTALDESSVQATAWVGGAVAAYDVTLSVGYGRLSLDGEATITSAAAPPALIGRTFGVDAETTATSIGLSLSRTFGAHWTVTPTLGVSYDRSESEQSARLPTTGAAPIRVESSADGVTGSLSAVVAGPLTDVLTLNFGATGYATENGAAQTLRFGRFDDARAFAPEPEGSAQWGELSAGLGWRINDRASVSATAGSTLGRDADTAFGALGLGVRF